VVNTTYACCAVAFVEHTAYTCCSLCIVAIAVDDMRSVPCTFDNRILCGYLTSELGSWSWMQAVGKDKNTLTGPNADPNGSALGEILSRSAMLERDVASQCHFEKLIVGTYNALLNGVILYDFK